MNEKNDIAAMSFEQAMRELENVVGKLERGDAELEQAIALYERGQKLRDHCDAKLKAAELKIEKITRDDKGEATGLEPAEFK